MQITPITPVIGAEVMGANLLQLSDNTFAALRDAFTEHSVLVFRDLPELLPEQQVAFAKRFGPLHTHPAAPTLEGHDEVFVIHAYLHKPTTAQSG